MTANTKERILEAAISLFSERGYGGVSIRDISREVGIKESSIYNHFSGKQQILEEIFDSLKLFDAVPADGRTTAEITAQMTPEVFMEFTVKTFEAYFGNPAFVRIWRILSMERFNNERARELYNRQFLDEPIEYQTAVFQTLMDMGKLPRQNPEHLAREFYSFFLYLYFRYIETDKTVPLSGNQGFQKMVREHMEFFSRAIELPPEAK